MNFISPDNTYQLDYLDRQNDMLALWLSNMVYAVFKYTGSIRFFKDGNGVGEVWLDAEPSLSVEFVPTLSDHVDSYNEKHVIELIVAKEFADERKLLEENS